MKFFAAALVASAASASGPLVPTATIDLGMEECIVAANIMRAARLDHRLRLLERSPSLEKSAQKVLQGLFSNGLQCNSLEESKVVSVPENIVATMLHDDQAECLDVMASVVDALLAASPTYPPAYNTAEAPWNTLETQVAARILWETTALAGCAYTTGCPVNCVVCQLSDQPQKGHHAFSKEIFQALQARKAAGIDLTSLTKEDIGSDLNGSSEGPWGFGAQTLVLALFAVSSAFAFAL
ncbi:hypothetical protein Esti_001048 [Eimeria stiedai]